MQVLADSCREVQETYRSLLEDHSIERCRVGTFAGGPCSLGRRCRVWLQKTGQIKQFSIHILQIPLAGRGEMVP